MKHADVPAAFDLVVEEVGKESQRICEAGSIELKKGNLTPAQTAIDYAEKLSLFVKKVRALSEEWADLQAEIDHATPEVKKIVLPPKPKTKSKRKAKPVVLQVAEPKPHATGYTRKVDKVSPKTNIAVTLPDGTVIQAKKASAVLGKTIEALGAEKVARLGLMIGEEPLVTKERSLYVKNPGQVTSIAKGWFVKTHSSTAAKKKMLEKIAKGLKVKLIITDC